jgi:chemotaxis protein methyltransferase CheR
MINQFSDIDVLKLKEFLHQLLGLNFLENQNKELIRKMNYAASKFGYPNLPSFLNWLYNRSLSKDEIGKLASHLTIGETYFMREKKGFDFLEQIYLPGLIHKRFNSERRLRIWCAGCATGEEAYSLAITAFQSIPNIEQWKISILATDINDSFLEKAQGATYTKWSFRSSTDDFKSKYFTTKDSQKYEVIPQIRKLVSFSKINLATDDFKDLLINSQSFDIIFCRNVLIYFSIEGALNVTGKMFEVLAPGGILVVSPVEVSSLISPRFETINYAGFTIYHKGKSEKEWIEQRNPELKKDKPTSKIDQKELEKLPQQPIKTFSPQSLSPNLKSIEKVTELTVPQRTIDQLTTIPLQSRSIEGKRPIEEKNSEEDLLLLAKGKANMGQMKEAELICEKALEINKLNPSVYYLLATIMQEQGNDEKALALIKKAIYLDADFILAHFLHGTLCLKGGNTVTGKKSFKTALAGLSKFDSTDILPESDGITVGRFKEIIQSITI